MITISEGKPNTYDEVPYESAPFQQLHPDRLATVARLFGIDAPPVQNCRVLELGCGNGGNLIPAAYSLPGASFLGFDLSSRQVNEGNSLVNELGLNNIELRVSNICDINLDIGKFDYIVAHGLFSWVPNEIQEKILQICRENLNDNGIAYISYNTFPGWHFRSIIRDLMVYHSKDIADPATRVFQAKAILDFVAKAVPTENHAYSILLNSESQTVNSQLDTYILHEYLEEINEPIYFHKFVQRAENHGLQFLGESDFGLMIPSNFPQPVAETLVKISPDIVHSEQYIDFIRNTPFRQSLLVKKELSFSRDINTQSILPFHFSTVLRAQNDPSNIRFDQAETFFLPNASNVLVNNPLCIAAYLSLAESFPQSLNFNELLTESISRLSAAGVQIAHTRDQLIQMLGNELLFASANHTVRLRTEKAPLVSKLSERPIASALARAQAIRQDWVTTQLHDMVKLDVISRQLIVLMNGQRNEQQILDALLNLVLQKALDVNVDGKSITDIPSLRSALETVVQSCMPQLLKAAILIA